MSSISVILGLHQQHEEKVQKCIIKMTFYVFFDEIKILLLLFCRIKNHVIELYVCTLHILKEKVVTGVKHKCD